MKEVKNKIKIFREQNKITQEQSAQYAEISLSYFQKLEKDLSIPNVYIALKLARLYNTTVEKLFLIN